MKKLLSTLALTLALGVPAWVSSAEPKPYDELSELQKGVFQMRAIVVADPGFARTLLENQGAEIASGAEHYDARDTLVFSGCFADHFMDYYGELDVMTYMNLSDDEITSYIGNYSFDVGVRCNYEVQESREQRRGA